MHWVVFSYSLPRHIRSGPRVAVWRRLGRLGALSTTSGVYVLPARDECVEAFQWLAQETRAAGGDAVLMRVEQFEGLPDAQLTEMFNEARRNDYQSLDKPLTALAKSAQSKQSARARANLQDSLAKLRKRYDDIARVDYFDCPDARTLAARLDRVAQSLAPHATDSAAPASATIAEYTHTHWVTRPHPHVDRLACIWLIRRFINPRAVVRYAARPEPDEIAFDMGGARFGHVGNRCSFETMLDAFGLNEAALRLLAEIVHAIDLRDGKSARPEIAGVNALLDGWWQAGFSDAQLESHGVALFDGLYHALSKRTPKRRAARQTQARGKR